MRGVCREVSERVMCGVWHQVSERALFLWNNEYIMNNVSEHAKEIFPIVFSALQNNTTHWNATVNGLTTQVLKLLKDLDWNLYDQCQAKHQEVCYVVAGAHLSSVQPDTCHAATVDSCPLSPPPTRVRC